MKISQEVDYALRVVLYLSKLGYGEKAEARLISEHESIPHRFLLKLLRKLTKKNIVKSFRGVNGGYALNKHPEQINLYDIILAIDGPIYMNRCMSSPENCNLSRSSFCEIHKALSKVQNNLIAELKNVNFKNLMEQ